MSGHKKPGPEPRVKFHWRNELRDIAWFFGIIFFVIAFCLVIGAVYGPGDYGR